MISADKKDNQKYLGPFTPTAGSVFTSAERNSAQTKTSVQFGVKWALDCFEYFSGDDTVNYQDQPYMKSKKFQQETRKRMPNC